MYSFYLYYCSTPPPNNYFSEKSSSFSSPATSIPVESPIFPSPGYSGYSHRSPSIRPSPANSFPDFDLSDSGLKSSTRTPNDTIESPMPEPEQPKVEIMIPPKPQPSKNR